MINLFGQIRAKIRNIFSIAIFQKRYDNGRLQVKTYSGRVIEQKESFSYGFAAKAKTGKTFVFCQGGDFGGFEIMPLMNDKISPPKLEDGDAALYTENGGWIIARDNGTLELFGTDAGGVVKAAELEKQLNKLSARVDGIINALNSSPVTPTDGGASFKAGIVSVLAALVDKENFANLESEKVLHGTG